MPFALPGSKRSAVPVAVCLAAVTACDSPAVPEWCVASDGAQLRVADEPAGWSTPPRLTVAWRIDGTAPGREIMTPTSAAISTVAERIAITDMRLREVIVIGLDGEWIGRWGSAGAGPGELRAPFASAWRPDGTLVVYDPAGSKLVVFDSSGATLDDVQVDPAFTAALAGGARSIQLDGSGLLLAEPGASFNGDGSTRVHTIVRGGRVSGGVSDGVSDGVDTVLRSDVPVITVDGAAPMSAPGWQVPLGAFHGDSILILAGGSPEYRVDVYRDGRLSHVICRNVEPQPFHADEAQPAGEQVPAPVRDAMANATRPEPPASIGRLLIDGERRLWVQRDRPRALAGLDPVMGRAGALHDVYDVNGYFLGEVRMPENVRLLGATDHLIIGLESSALDELSVVAFEFGVTQ